MTKTPPPKRQGHTQAEEIKHLKHEVRELKEQQERLMATAAELKTDLDALTAAVAALPAPAAALITQPELDAADQAVKDATAAVVAKTPPTP